MVRHKVSGTSKRRTTAGAPVPPGNLRIIGGRWRGRKLTFPALEGVRPTPDRLRETLFNWLQAAVPGARVLDGFAGSGALGLEALSRGAAQVTWVDSQRPLCDNLRQLLATLGSADGQVVQAELEPWLSRTPAEPFDLVFLDPPYRKNLLPACVAQLEERGWLAEDAWIYVEISSDEPLPVLPTHWQLHREKVTGQVACRLYRRQPS